MDIFLTKTDITQIYLEHQCIFCGFLTFYDAINMIHDVIRSNPFPCTAKFMFVRVRNNETHQIKR